MPKKTRVSQVIKVKPLLPGGLSSDALYNSSDFIGVELELENINSNAFHEYIGEWWECVTDHSLKFNGNELRFRTALNGSSITSALDIVRSGITKYGLEPYTDGNRGSTHIHLNVSNLTIKELFNIILLSYFLEPVLMDMCHDDRLFSPFSVPSSRTKDQKFVLNLIQQGRVNFDSNMYKYRSIGLSSVYRKGSLEYRMFHATYNTVEVLRWINFIQEMKDIATSTTKLQEVIQSCLDSSIQSVLRDLFGRTIPISERARKEMWDFVREYTFNPIEEIEMTQKISKFYREADK